MSAKYIREEKEIDRLYLENRKLKAENRRLHKIAKQLNRGYKQLREDNAVEEEELPDISRKLCYNCNGEYKEMIICGRRFRQCQECGRRGKVTIL